MSAEPTSSGETLPPAASTSGSAWTLLSSEAGTVGTPEAPSAEFLTISLPLITASVLSYVAAKRPSNDFCIVSVRM